MPRTELTVTDLDRAGVAPPAQLDADATNKHLMTNNGSTWIEIVSSDAGSQTISIDFAATVDGVTVGPRVVTIPAGATRLSGPWPTQTYNVSTAADGTLTSDAVAPADGETVTIGSQVYTFKTTLTATANQVKIGANAAEALTNLKAAINAAAGEGTLYGTGTTANALVTAGTLTATTLLVTAKTAGVGGNSCATTETSTHLSWGGATLSGGAASVITFTPSVSTTLKFRAYSI